MVDHNIQMKKNTNGKWDNLYPMSKIKNIHDDLSNKSLDEI